MTTTIKAKLIIGISIILALLFFTTLYVLDKLSSMNERMTNIVDGSAQRVTLSNDIMVGVLDVTRNEKNIILEKNIAEKINFESEINQGLGLVDKNIKELEKKIISKEGEKILSDFKEAWTEYNSGLKEIVKLTKSGNDSEAFNLSVGRVRDLRLNTINIMREMIQLNKEKMQEDKIASNENYNSSLNIIIVLIIVSLMVTAFISYSIITTITKRISAIAEGATKIASREFMGLSFNEMIKDELRPIALSLNSVVDSFQEITSSANEVAKGDYSVKVIPKSGGDIIGNALNKMTESLKKSTSENQRYNWLTTGQNSLNEKLAGDQSVEDLSNNAVTFLSNYVNANIGSLYLVEDNSLELKLSGKYAFSHSDIANKKFLIGEGIIGQAAADQKHISLTNINESDLRLNSSILEARPKNIFACPFILEQKVLGVIELGKRELFSETEVEFLTNSMETIAISVNSALARKRIQVLLEETQRQAEELQVQQEELKQMNEELEEQTQSLKQQQEELQVANEELEHQTQSIELKNRELEATKIEVERKSKDLEMSSKYKSEFLANMSHELRTPLNSLLILSRDLADNKKKNLEEFQVESAQIIYNSGKDLLQLINEVLDLSKIEAGKMDLNVERLELKEFSGSVSRNFKHIASTKGLNFIVNLEKGIPEFIRTDRQRLEQILRNLISNAVKFTHHGSISVNFRKNSVNSIAIDVIDTGIGISEEKHALIFEAFQQAEGGTARKYGGTGLGLSISKELTRLIGGYITLSSKANEGSTFTLVIPLSISSSEANTPLEINTEKLSEKFNPDKEISTTQLIDDRNNIDQKDKSILIIEDDEKFAKILLDQARQRNFKVLVAATGEDGLMLASKYMPQAIILDLMLPDMNGKTVLAELKSNPSLRHIPVHIISATERTLDTIKGGAVEYLRKPIDRAQMEEAFLRMENFISRKMKNLLIVEDDKNSRRSIKLLIGNGDVKCFEAENGKQALEILKEKDIDCIVLDLGLPDMTGFELIKKLGKIKDIKVPPIIVYTGKDLSKSENDELQSFAETIIIKGVKSEERLLDETALFLHRTVSELPDSKRLMITELYDKEALFTNKRILLVDDDMRNVFALSKVLKEAGMEIIKAENGIKALEALNLYPETDLVLMDIMMPEMDGYEAMKIIRMQDRFKKLPILALTAKAMKEDRNKCIEAGANDYISKPIEIERLLSLMRIWIKK
jgi:CheY-like chemotaxis protein/putative methionine-R-sulfoxide reductase with GAF domain